MDQRARMSLNAANSHAEIVAVREEQERMKQESGLQAQSLVELERKLELLGLVGFLGLCACAMALGFLFAK